MQTLKGKIILITGGAQGLGLNTAAEFVEEGCVIILTDINEQTLSKGKDILSGKGAQVFTYKVDVTKKEEVDELAKKVLEKFDHVDVLINNAGIGYQGELEDTSIATWKKLMDVNFWGPLYHIYAFLPAMKERGKGHIVNISSGQAFFRIPTWGAYASIKLAIGAVSEIMHFELKKYNIDVTTVYPYMVNTGFYNEIESQTLGGKLSMLFLPLYAQKPATVARIIFNAVKKNKKVEMVSPINYFAKYLHFLPATSDASYSLLTLAMAKPKKEIKEKGKMANLLEDSFNKLGKVIDSSAGGLGFGINETMIGEHEFTKGEGPEGKLPFQFDVRWGVNSITDWSNPFKKSFLINDLKGTVSMGGLGKDIPCKGKLELKYFDEQKIRYTFDFKVKGKEYEYIGEKKQIYPWNLPYSHTTCFGKVIEKKTGKLISKSITHFRLEDLPEFVKSIKLERPPIKTSMPVV